MTAAAGPYAGLDRFEARKRVVADLEKLGLLVKIEDYTLASARASGARTSVEPLVSTQWFVKMKPLAEPAIARGGGRRAFSSFPSNWSRPTTNGCTTSATGASRASSGGDTGSRPGIAANAAR